MEKNNKTNAKCFIISAPSGAGKTTLKDKLMENNPGAFYDSISDATRDKRLGEVDGKDYNFITIPQFESEVSEGRYLEWAKVHENFYGTPRTPLLDAMNDGKSPLVIVDVKGCSQARENISYDKLCSIFILPPEEKELVRRIQKRGDMRKKDLEIRLENAKKECKFAPEFKYCVTNDDFDLAYSILEFIIKKELEF